MKHHADLPVHDSIISFEYSMQRAEPDVGIMSDYVEEWWPTAVDGEAISEAVAKLLSSVLSHDDICVRLGEQHEEPDYD